MKPTVGRIVHYQAFGTPGGEYKSEPRAAVITEVFFLPGAELTDEKGYAISLCVLNPSGVFFNSNLFYDADGKPGTWRWPPRE